MTFDSSAFSEFLKNGWFQAQTDRRQWRIGWGVKSGANDKAHALFAPSFYTLGESAHIETAFSALIDRDQLATLVMAKLERDVNAGDQGFQWVEPDREVFARRLMEIKEGMQNRGLQKAVPVVFARARADLGEQRRLAIILRLLSLKVDTIFPYGFWRSNGESFCEGMIGATPEILFKTKALANGGIEIETVAIAGTRGKGDGLQPHLALLQDPKERQEHQFVIDDIARVLGRLGSVEIGETGIVELPTLFHLRTPIRAQLREAIDFWAIASLLHPTPALGVAPRELGFTEMRRWDDADLRLRFGAPFGSGDTCLVAIRNIQWTGNDVILGSGCGIVAASDAEREWAELKLKRDSVRRILGV